LEMSTLYILWWEKGNEKYSCRVVCQLACILFLILPANFFFLFLYFPSPSFDSPNLMLSYRIAKQQETLNITAITPLVHLSWRYNACVLIQNELKIISHAPSQRNTSCDLQPLYPRISSSQPSLALKTPGGESCYC